MRADVRARLVEWPPCLAQGHGNCNFRSCGVISAPAPAFHVGACFPIPALSDGAVGWAAVSLQLARSLTVPLSSRYRAVVALLLQCCYQCALWCMKIACFCSALYHARANRRFFNLLCTSLQLSAALSLSLSPFLCDSVAAAPLRFAASLSHLLAASPAACSFSTQLGDRSLDSLARAH